MNYTSSNKGFPAGNPIANALVIIVGALAIGASIVLGFLAFVVLSSVLIVFAAIVGIRVWWFRRKFEKAQANRPPGDSPATAGVIEGEYHIVVEEKILREDDSGRG